MKMEAIDTFTFLVNWKKSTMDSLLLIDPSLNKKMVNTALDEIIFNMINNRELALVNNYTNKIAKTDVLSLINMIYDNNLLLAGAGVLFLPHDAKPNPLIDFILYIMGQRAKFKKIRKKYAKFSEEWYEADRSQNSKKLVINSLYGAIGYAMFVLHNRFIAESVTNTGRNILSSAAESFEAFLSDSVNFSTEEELMVYINNIVEEYNSLYKGKLDLGEIFNLKEDWYSKVYNRLLNKCKFNYDNNIPSIIGDMLLNLDAENLVLLYYKNNFFEFCRNDFIKEKILYIVNNTDNSEMWNLSTNSNERVNDMMNSILEFLSIFVLYDYPCYDRIRKCIYVDKGSVCYMDTDSNFIGLYRFASLVKDEFCNNHYNRSEDEVDIMSVSIALAICNVVVDKALHTMCKFMNVPKEFADQLGMKNEFFMNRIVFTGAKKRYISNAIYQEGQLLKDGIGEPEIKGFDFKKASVKAHITEFYTQICLDDILRSKEIDIEKIYGKMIWLKHDIEQSMLKGESKYYKQTTVQILEHYKFPYSNAASSAVVLWNVLCPEYRIDLPSDVDVVPIKSLGARKLVEKTEAKINPKTGGIMKVESTTFDLERNGTVTIRKFAELFPEAYDRLLNGIYLNPDLAIRKMSMNYIAKPKNDNIILPDWYSFLVDTEKVVNDTLGLFYPILESLGMKMLKTNASTQHLSNIVSL